MTVFQLPATGTVIMVQGGLALLAAAFAIQYLVKRVRGKK